jgi:hypothetical protein
VFLFHFTKLHLYLKQFEPTVVAKSETSKLIDDSVPPAIADPKNVIFI